MFWRKLFGTRKRWAIIASVGMLLAAITEAIWHPLASMLCDVPGDPWAVMGLLMLIAAPLLSEWALRVESLPAMRIARCMNGAAWVFWLMLFITIWPAYIFAGIALPFIPYLLFSSMSGRNFGSELGMATVIFAFLCLVLTPLIASIVLLCQHVALRKVPMPGLRKPLWWTVFIAVCLWGFRPLLLGYHLNRALHTGPESREKSLMILRAIGGEYDLRMLSYKRRPTFSAVLARGGGIFLIDHPSEDTDAARRAYFLLTGQPYTEAPVPPAQMGLLNNNDFLKIEEQGGEKVGSKVEGVTLSASTLETKVEPATRTAQFLWTLTFANSSAEGQEARATVRLPENAVISGAWLWIKGEKRPAAFGGKAQVRAAYEEVVKVQRRDPLLVTQTDPRRALVQCFPVPPKGEMQIQLEITQFFGENRLALPALTDTNFTQPNSLRHRVSVQGDGTERALAFTEEQMLHPAPVSLTPFSPGSSRKKEAPIDLTIAIDTSKQVGSWVRGHRDWLAAIEKVLPAGSNVHYADTRLPQPVETNSLDEALDWRFTGGVDAVPALATLVKQSAKQRSAILWIHGPMPAEATDLHDLYLAITENQGVRLLGVLTTPGPDPVMDGTAAYKNIWVKDDSTPESIVATASAADSGPANITPLGGRWPAAHGFTQTDSDERATSLGKLHAWSRTLSGWYGGDRAPALARYAASRRLVTPISGAVVLENKEQYERHGLDPNKAPKDDPNPQVATIAPEPGSLALLLLTIPLFLGIRRFSRW
ncbi:MAG: VIT domain-containing protein [Armatimonas sp.]